MFKCGDVVILSTGGNKMTIDKMVDNYNNYRCLWFVGTEFKESVFSGIDLVLFDDWRRCGDIQESRELIIFNILSYS